MIKTLLATALASAFCVAAYAQNDSHQSGSTPQHQVPGAGGQAVNPNSMGNSSSQSSGQASDQTNGNSSAQNGQQGVQPLQIVRESVMVQGIVHSVDRENRVVTLQGPAGNVLMVHVGNEVQNFDKLKAGEPATIRYREAAVVAIERGGAAGKHAQSQSGQQPSAQNQQSSQSHGGPGLPIQSSVIGKVTKIDPSANTITVRNQQGQQMDLRAPPNVLSGISKGDQVFVTYSEAAAISVQPGSTTGEQQPGHGSGQMDQQSGQTSSQTNQQSKQTSGRANQQSGHPTSQASQSSGQGASKFEQ